MEKSAQTRWGGGAGVSVLASKHYYAMREEFLGPQCRPQGYLSLG